VYWKGLSEVAVDNNTLSVLWKLVLLKANMDQNTASAS